MAREKTCKIDSIEGSACLKSFDFKNLLEKSKKTDVAQKGFQIHIFWIFGNFDLGEFYEMWRTMNWILIWNNDEETVEYKCVYQISKNPIDSI